MDPFPDDPIRTPCPGCRTTVLFPRLLNIQPGTSMSCNCTRCGHRVTIVVQSGSHPSRARSLAVLFVAICLIAGVVLLILK